MSDRRPGSRHRSLRFESVGLEVPAPNGDRATTTILHDVDAEIDLRGLTALVGPSGSGKSTLLRLCNRLEVPSTGRVLLDGDDVADLDPLALRRRVGMVFQRPTAFAGTVRDNLHVAAPDASDEACREVLERCGLDRTFLDRQADELSGGEAQRMCLARTLLTDPSVVLMDEVTSSLDPDNRRHIEQLADDLVAAGIGIVWVTHDLDQADRVAQRVLVIDGGTMVEGTR